MLLSDFAALMPAVQLVLSLLSGAVILLPHLLRPFVTCFSVLWYGEPSTAMIVHCLRQDHQFDKHLLLVNAFSSTTLKLTSFFGINKPKICSKQQKIYPELKAHFPFLCLSLPFFSPQNPIVFGPGMYLEKKNSHYFTNHPGTSTSQ